MKLQLASNQLKNRDRVYKAAVILYTVVSKNEKAMAALESLMSAAATSKLLNQTTTFVIEKETHELTMQEIDDVLSQTMKIKPAAFSDNKFNGRTQREKLKATWLGLRKRPAKRKQGQFLYAQSSGLFRDDKMIGTWLNKNIGF